MTLQGPSGFHTGGGPLDVYRQAGLALITYINAHGCDGTSDFSLAVSAFQTAENGAIEALNKSLGKNVPDIPVDGTYTFFTQTKLVAIAASEQPPVVFTPCQVGFEPPIPKPLPLPPLPPTPTPTPPAPAVGSNTGWWIAGGLLALLVIGGLIVTSQSPAVTPAARQLSSHEGPPRVRRRRRRSRRRRRR